MTNNYTNGNFVGEVFFQKIGPVNQINQTKQEKNPCTLKNIFTMYMIVYQ